VTLSPSHINEKHIKKLHEVGFLGNFNIVNLVYEKNDQIAFLQEGRNDN
jgi:hypothetical protein